MLKVLLVVSSLRISKDPSPDTPTLVFFGKKNKGNPRESKVFSLQGTPKRKEKCSKRKAQGNSWWAGLVPKSQNFPPFIVKITPT